MPNPSDRLGVTGKPPVAGPLRYMSTAFEVSLIFTTQIYQNFSVFCSICTSGEPEVFLPKYSQTAILHAAHFRRVVDPVSYKPMS